LSSGPVCIYTALISCCSLLLLVAGCWHSFVLAASLRKKKKKNIQNSENSRIKVAKFQWKHVFVVWQDADEKSKVVMKSSIECSCVYNPASYCASSRTVSCQMSEVPPRGYV
jgi:hypothetical protein